MTNVKLLDIIIWHCTAAKTCSGSSAVPAAWHCMAQVLCWRFLWRELAAGADSYSPAAWCGALFRVATGDSAGFHGVQRCRDLAAAALGAHACTPCRVCPVVSVKWPHSCSRRYRLQRCPAQSSLPAAQTLRDTWLIAEQTKASLQEYRLS